MISLQDVRRFRAAVRGIEREVVLRLKEQSTCCGVTLAQCHVLLELQLADSLVTTSVLAKKFGLDKSTLSRTLNGLEDAKLIRRNTDCGDRRLLGITLTSQGRRTAQRINQHGDAFYQEMFKLVPAGQQAKLMEAVEILSKVMESMRERSREPFSRKS